MATLLQIKGSGGEESAAELSEGDDLGIDGNEGGGWRPSQNSRFMARKVRFTFTLRVLLHG